jgi:hypothetical protein
MNITKKKPYFFILILSLLIFSSCKKYKEDKNDNDDNLKSEPTLIFKVKINATQERLNNIGQPATIPDGHSAQTPRFNTIAAHYIELTPTPFTQVGDGEVLYHAPETQEGGSLAIDFSKTRLVKDGEIIFSIPISEVKAGGYEYARVSVAYQNYDVDFRAQGLDMTATLASFVGYNTYITTHTVKNMQDQVNGNREQGYWAWETHPTPPMTNPILQTGQAPGTTVPNPISGTSPIPPGSCLVTGEFTEKFIIKENETEDIVIELSFSVNNSFEWLDENENGIFEPLDGDVVVDMGLRGLVAKRLN